MNKPTRDMSDRQESFLARLFGGRRTIGSGSTTDKGDGRTEKFEQTYCFAWDAKSTRDRSISVKLSDWDKVRDQTIGYTPMLPLRFYLDDRLDAVVDLVVLDAHDLAELVEMANTVNALKCEINEADSALFWEKGTGAWKPPYPEVVRPGDIS